LRVKFFIGRKEQRQSDSHLRHEICFIGHHSLVLIMKNKNQQTMSSQTVTCQLVREVAVTQNAYKSCHLMCQRHIKCTKIKEISTGNDICVGDTFVI